MADTMQNQPPKHAIDAAIYASTLSPCRSKRGVAIFERWRVCGTGFNRKPHPFTCDGSDACKVTCRKEAVHAEQDALLSTRGDIMPNTDMLHVKTVDGVLVPSGPPSCVECSKLILRATISGMWLYHTDGWRRYTAEEFHRLSIEHKAQCETR